MKRLLPVLAALALVSLAPSAQAAKTCAEPSDASDGWERATPAEAGMDGAKLQEAVDYAATQAAYAIRIYRHGCLVAADRTLPLTQEAWYESWSMAKSITALAFGRAMTLGLISADDPVGSLIPEADAAHGAITLRQLLEMTSGLRWNGFRDYNITMEDRMLDFLTVEIARTPGTWYEYSQTGPFTVAEAISRAAGEDVQDFLQRELFTPLGIEGGTWKWERDGKGRTQGFFGVMMRPDDYARLGELMRRGGVWKGQRLLSQRFIRQALTPSATNGCYGWLIWLNAAKPCIGPTVSDRPVRDRRQFPGLPADLYRFSGLFGQIVAVFPTQGITVVRNGSDPGLVPAGGQGWERGIYDRVLGAVTDEEIPESGDAPAVTGDGEQPNPDAGFQYAWQESDQYGAPMGDGPLPAAGPFRQRALVVHTATAKPNRRKVVRVQVSCPKGAARACAGQATLKGARRAVAYEVAPGVTKRLRFKLKGKPRGALFTAVNTDDAGGTTSTARIALRKTARR